MKGERVGTTFGLAQPSSKEDPEQLYVQFDKENEFRPVLVEAWDGYSCAARLNLTQVQAFELGTLLLDASAGKPHMDWPHASDAEEIQALRKIRERRAREAEQQRKLEEASRLRRAYWDGDTWVQRDRVPIAVRNMTPNHARNSIKWAEYLYRRDAVRYGWSCDRPPLLKHLLARASRRATLSDRLRDRAARRRYAHTDQAERDRHAREVTRILHQKLHWNLDEWEE